MATLKKLPQSAPNTNAIPRTAHSGSSEASIDANLLRPRPRREESGGRRDRAARLPRMPRDPKDEHLGGAMAVYAAAAGLASVVPVPILDAFVTRLARGAAMRRVAKRRGVRMTREARAILSAPGATQKSGSLPVRLARRAIQTVVPPVAVAARTEEAIATFSAAILFDHY